jgi:hypothetical protein
LFAAAFAFASSSSSSFCVASLAQREALDVARGEKQVGV